MYANSIFALALVAVLPFAGEAATPAGQQAMEAVEPGLRVEAGATEVSRTPYQAYLYPPDCINGSNICKLATDVVPSRSRLEIHRLACMGNHSGTLVPDVTAFLDLETAAGAYAQRVDLMVGQVTRNPPSTLSLWAISEQTLIFVPARHRLQITVSTGSPINTSVGCTISGYLVKLKS